MSLLTNHLTYDDTFNPLFLFYRLNMFIAMGRSEFKGWQSLSSDITVTSWPFKYEISVVLSVVLTCGKHHFLGDQPQLHDWELRQLQTVHPGHSVVPPLPEEHNVVCGVAVCKGTNENKSFSQTHTHIKQCSVQSQCYQLYLFVLTRWASPINKCKHGQFCTTYISISVWIFAPSLRVINLQLQQLLQILLHTRWTVIYL